MLIRNGIERHVKWRDLGVEEVKTVGDGMEAYDLCCNYKPDIIFFDIRMPGMSRVEFCTKIKGK